MMLVQDIPRLHCFVYSKSIGQSVLEIESIGYDEMLGGKTLTNSAYSLVLEKFLNQFNLEESDLTDKIAARLQDTAEKPR